MRRIAIGAAFSLAFGLCGCSSSTSETPVAEAAPVAPPEAAVTQFLESIRTGNHKQAEAMLTDTAREKTAQADLMVAPPGSPTAKFEIAGVKVIDNQIAHVGSIWTDIGDDGKPQSNEFVWALRMEPQGWRIAGVAVELFPNQPPLLLDFEDPADMMRKQQMAEAEMQRQMNPQAAPTGAVAAPATGAAPTTGVQTVGGTAPLGNAATGATVGPTIDPNVGTAGFGNPNVNPAAGQPATSNIPPAGTFSPPGPFPGTTGATAPLQAEQPQTVLPR